ncbi:MAG: hypothetical protein VX768_19415 [Planctomycetota bacterium]|nr:hypothetical protein [Planctomycetota bacterium]
MHNLPDNSMMEQIRQQMDCVHGSSRELLERPAGEHPELELLLEWLQASEENRKLFDRQKEEENEIRRAMQAPRFQLETSKLDKMIRRLKDRVDHKPLTEKGDLPPAEKGSEVSAGHFRSIPLADSIIPEDSPASRSAVRQKVDGEFASLFAESEQQLSDDSISRASPGLAKNGALAGGSSPASGGNRWWWMGTACSALILAGTVLLVQLWPPPSSPPQATYTAEMLCSDSLSWDPGSPVDTDWNENLDEAPEERRFPSHLVRHQARSWRLTSIQGDTQAVVYNLVPRGHLSEKKAYLYVFKTDRQVDLPHQFTSHPLANRKYRFWSVACQQELVFVLVFEGEEKRLPELVKFQEVG